MKKVRSNTVTSLIAVMSMNVLFLAIFTLPILAINFFGLKIEIIVFAMPAD